jgi:integrase
MAILAECPTCHRKQATKNKVCKCGQDLDKAKRAKKVRYWIDDRLPNGKAKREPAGFSMDKARDAEAKRRSQKRELGDRFYEVLQEDRITFKELTEWYLNLQSVKRLSSCDRYSIWLNNFNKVLGDRLIRDIKAIDLEDYQAKRLADGIAPKTIDEEIAVVHRMVRKADDNDMIDPRILKAFKRTKKLVRRGENARERVLSIGEYLELLGEAVGHLRAILKVAMNTGMRHSEILALKWSHVDLKKWMIRLTAEITKERKPKSIPINKTVREVFESQPRALHHDHVFTYKGEAIKGYVRKAIMGACRRAGIPYGRSVEGGFIFQDIRRTVKTAMARAGIDKVYRDTILGHSLEGMDVHYLKPSDDDLHAAMEKYSSWLEDEIANVDQTVDQEAR